MTEGKYVTIFSWTKKYGLEWSYVQDYNIKSYLAHTRLYESARKNEKISLQFATKHTCVSSNEINQIYVRIFCEQKS